MDKKHVKKGDRVLVIAGKDRGTTSKVLRVIPSANRAIVENVNMIKRHTRPNPQKRVQGGILEREAPIHLSNLMVIDPGGEPTRVGRKRLQDGGGTRVSKKSGSEIG
jgi:large subunit ribosomal protein L24